jgi:hypothetical protein
MEEIADYVYVERWKDVKSPGDNTARFIGCDQKVVGKHLFPRNSIHPKHLFSGLIAVTQVFSRNFASASVV